MHKHWLFSKEFKNHIFYLSGIHKQNTILLSTQEHWESQENQTQSRIGQICLAASAVLHVLTV